MIILLTFAYNASSIIVRIPLNTWVILFSVLIALLYPISLPLIQFYQYCFMQRLKRKQLQQLRLQKEQRAIEQKAALRHMIKSQERMEILLHFAEEFLRGGNMQSLAEYSPTQISRLVFDRELQLIKREFQRLPDGQVKLEHFIILMLRVMGFPFEKSPYYMVGLKDMFHQVATEGSETIDYPSFFRYILGELVSIKQEEQNTEFQVQIQERKKQDYLLHDNGIKRIRYSRDLRVAFSLDERDKAVKIYDHDMKHIAKFSAKKEKHGNKFPFILDFDYSQISTRLGVIFSDDTLSTVHIPHLLSKSQAEFDQGGMNELVFGLPEPMQYVFFIQMLNKWLTVSDTGMSLYLFDMERVRSQPEKVMSKLSLNTNELRVRLVLEVVPLSCICITAGNEVSFYNENLTDTKFSKFVHVEEIEHFKYSDQKNQFYLCGREKAITIFTISRSGNPSKIWNFPINKIITDFQVFPYFDTIVIADQNNDVRLMHESTRTVYQQVGYSHIVKSRDRPIKIFKISKNEFTIYQTYQIVLTQEKIAIQRGIEYSFLPYFHVDHRKEELFLSVNHQIISFSLLSGEIRRSYSMDTSNIDKHFCFFVGGKTPLFVLDHEFNLYEVYGKEQMTEGENRSYKKKVNIDEAISCFYDDDLQNLMIIGKNTVTQVRNDKNNNFNFVNGVFLERFSAISKATFCPQTKTLTFLTADQLIYQMKNYEHSIQGCFKFIFPKDDRQHEQGLILNFHYQSTYDLFVLFTNKNELYFVERTGQHRQIYFSIQEHLPAKLKNCKFTGMRYQLIEEKKGFEEHYILLTDQTGIIIQFPLTKIYEEFNITAKQQSSTIKPMFKETQMITNEDIPINEIQLSQGQRLKRTYLDVGLMKAHEKTIAIALKLKLQIMTTLTISIDGYIRLWNDKYDLLFSLKIPSLIRLVWNMKEIEDIKNRKSINQLLSIFQNHYREAMHENSSPVQVYNKSKRLKKGGGDMPRVNLNDPIRIDIQNKDIEEIVMQRPDYTHYSSPDKSKTQHFFHTTQKVYPHPWRTKREFVKIYEKASPPHKYKQRMPQGLLEMRSSLDMTEKVKEVPTYKEAELILPQLTFYQPESSPSQRKKEDTRGTEDRQGPGQGQNFESCLYVKSVRRKKKINEFDQIDKEFKKKEMVLTARKWVPKKRKERTSSVIEMKAEAAGLLNEGKADPIKSIQKIFEEHNRECMETKKGRLIKIPKINLNKDFY